jgi:molybdenum cofactor biosynthesis protein B
MKANKSFKPLNIAVLTLSDKRTVNDDTTGDLLDELATEAGHLVVERRISSHDFYQIRAVVSQWIADDNIHVIITNGGTGFSADNVTQDAIEPLLASHIDGFGELFRQLSYDDIGTSSMQSRAFAGLANKTLVAAVPGSGGAAKLAWEKLLAPQIDARQGPCNFVGHLV